MCTAEGLLLDSFTTVATSNMSGKQEWLFSKKNIKSNYYYTMHPLGLKRILDFVDNSVMMYRVRIANQKDMLYKQVYNHLYVSLSI